MPRTYLCFLWHMHQPFYKDLVSGEYRLPWTRMHALKDYYGMVRILEEFPGVRQTFNLVPSMMTQVDEYARGLAADPFLHAALARTEDLSEAQQELLLANSFHVNLERIISRYPRYRELYDVWQASQRKLDRARRTLGLQGIRDLQVLSQLAWFDEEYLEHDPEVRALIEKGRDFNSNDQAVVGRKELEICARVIPEYRKLAASGQIEISTTPFYHPILPLTCDSNIAAVSHPAVTLPSRFRYPQDARRQLEMARSYITEVFGKAPQGLWPSEGSVSDEALGIAVECGFTWAATDSGVLGATLGRHAGVSEIYRPYVWRQSDHEMRMMFRDHYLSDLIGFVYARMGAVQAAEDLLHRIRENTRGILESGRDALVPIILDGENAWEYFDLNGRPFLRELYGRIERDSQMEAITVSEAFARLSADTIDHIFPGSWINANFDVWIGAEEDNRAWEYLLRARQTYDHAKGVSEEARHLAYEELLIAEGSDWCWWYGPEHDSAHRPEFDQLYRDHLANVYRALGLAPPDELSRPILKSEAHAFLEPPSGAIHPVVDGEVGSYFEWLGAGTYRTDERSGSMHGKRSLVREIRFGTDGQSLFLLLDLHGRPAGDLASVEVRLTVECADARVLVPVGFPGGAPKVVDGGGLKVDCAYGSALEIAVHVGIAGPVRFQLSLWEDGLPMDAVPQAGWLEVAAAGEE